MPHFFARTHAKRSNGHTQAPDRQPAFVRIPTQEEIARQAYSYWEARGRTNGSPWEDWFRAERELMGHLRA